MYLRTVEAKTRNPGVIVHRAPINLGVRGHRKVL